VTARTRAVLVLLVAGAAGAALSAGLLERLPSLCPLRNCAGIPCAGCGLTRAMGCLARGDAGGAFRFHPASFAFALVLAGAAALLVAEVATGRDLLAPAWMRHRNALGWALAAALVAGCVLRHLAGAPTVAG
jgi:hypothetical protein